MLSIGLCDLLVTLLLGDSVYMAKEKHREEYIMNESGLIYAGTYDDMFTWPWNFAQVQHSLTGDSALNLCGCICIMYTFNK